MNITFICLANSKKYGERCIAGIEIRLDLPSQTYLIQQKPDDDGRLIPRWIRPVTDAAFGQVPAELVKNFHLLDIVEMNTLRPAPKEYQTENVLFEVESLRVVGRVVPENANLADLADHETTLLFGNSRRSISADDIDEVTASLIFIEVRELAIYQKEERERPQIRATFFHHHHDYDLPLTDVQFIEKWQSDAAILTGKTRFYLTISLGIEFEGAFYKLVAGVVAV